MSLLLCPIPVICDIWSFISAIPRLALVCKRWKEMTEDEHVWQLISGNIGSIDFSGCANMREFWESNYCHKKWRPSNDNLMVDFESSRIPNLENDEGAISQMYYTYPRVGLQFKTRFTLYCIETCDNLTRIALKKGCHLGMPPCTETAEYLATGLASDTIVKLDFSVDRSFHTNVVVWTHSSIELFIIPPKTYRGLTVSERRFIYELKPLTRSRVISTQGELGFPGRKVLLIHINDEGNIGVLTTIESQSMGMLHIFNFNTGKLLHEVAVNSNISPDSSVPTGEWKSRERSDFKGSSEIAALIDDAGVVQVYHYEAKQWCTCPAKYYNSDNGNGPRPKLLRTSGSLIIFWNSGSQNSQPPYYVEVHKINYRKDSYTELSSTRVLCECYSTINSAYIDNFRCYVSAVLPNNDMFVDVWDTKGGFVSRTHSVNNAWSPEKKTSRIYMSKVFWSYNGGVMYFELASSSSRDIKMAFRQVLCVPKIEYWQTCSDLKGDAGVKKETHQVTTSTRKTSCIAEMYPGKLSPEFKSSGIQVTGF